MMRTILNIWRSIRGFVAPRHISDSGIKVRLYLSHPIRGSAAGAATKDCQFTNAERAVIAANLISSKLSHISIFCPGSYEKFVYYIYAGKLLTDKQIIDIDCRIVGDCNGLLAYDFDKSVGVEAEVKYAKDHGIPVLRFKEINGKTIKEIKSFVNDIIQSKQID